MKYLRILFVLAVAAVIVFLGPQLLDYTKTRDAIPTGVTMSGVNIGGATTEEAVENLRSVFESPVLVLHGDNRLVLRPEEIGFTVDAETMVEQAQQYGAGLYAVRDFWLYVLQQPPLGGDVPLIYEYDRDKLGAWLQAQAEEYDNDPTPGYAKLDTLTFVPGQPGRYANLSESAIDIVKAFQSTNDRSARLEIREQPELPPDFEALENALQQRLDKFPGIYSVYFQHLPTGEVIDIDADTAFAGMSTVKLPVLLKVYQEFEAPLDDNISRWISDTVKSETASNAAANALMYHIGGTDTLTGAREVTEFSRELGLDDTFIAIPYDSDLRPPFVSTPANTNPEYNTFPDPAMQTTPRDVGELMAEIGYCAEGRGNLLAAYPDQITRQECEELVGWMEQNPMGYLIKYGVPDDARIAHKHGYGTDTQGDVALIYGPEGPYSLAIFVYQQGWVVWDYSNPLMNDLSRLIWNFFLVRQGEEQLPPFDPEEQIGAGVS